MNCARLQECTVSDFEWIFSSPKGNWIVNTSWKTEIQPGEYVCRRSERPDIRSRLLEMAESKRLPEGMVIAHYFDDKSVDPQDCSGMTRRFLVLWFSEPPHTYDI